MEPWRSPRLKEKSDKIQQEQELAAVKETIDQIDKTLNNTPIEKVKTYSWIGVEQDEKEYEVTDCATVKLTTLAYAIFGQTVVDEFLKEKRTIRSIWELTPPTIQCNNTIGKKDKNTTCWICGFKSEDITIDGLDFSCDHVLPIAQARFFLDLYNPLFKKQTDETKSNIFKLEYAWAHQFCNNLKKDLTIIAGTEDEQGFPVWKPDVKNIKEMLGRIINYKYDHYKNAQKYIKGKIGNNIQKWIDSRKDSIIEEKAMPILDHIQNNREKGSGKLIMLAGYASCMSPTNIRKEFNDILVSYKDELKKEAIAIDGLLKLSQPQQVDFVTQAANVLTSLGKRKLEQSESVYTTPVKRRGGTIKNKLGGARKTRRNK